MLRWKLLKASLVAAVVSFAASYGYAAEFSARLNGFNELGSLPSATAFPTGAVLSDGTGTVSLQLDQKASTNRLHADLREGRHHATENGNGIAGSHPFRQVAHFRRCPRVFLHEPDVFRDGANATSLSQE